MNEIESIDRIVTSPTLKYDCNCDKYHCPECGYCLVRKYEDDIWWEVYLCEMCGQEIMLFGFDRYK